MNCGNNDERMRFAAAMLVFANLCCIYDHSAPMRIFFKLAGLMNCKYRLSRWHGTTDHEEDVEYNGGREYDLIHETMIADIGKGKWPEGFNANSSFCAFTGWSPVLDDGYFCADKTTISLMQTKDCQSLAKSIWNDILECKLVLWGNVTSAFMPIEEYIYTIFEAQELQPLPTPQQCKHCGCKCSYAHAKHPVCKLKDKYLEAIIECKGDRDLIYRVVNYIDLNAPLWFPSFEDGEMNPMPEFGLGLDVEIKKLVDSKGKESVNTISSQYFLMSVK
jgi:hypothetical protein